VKLVRALLVESRREKTKRQEEVLQQDHQEVVRAKGEEVGVEFRRQAPAAGPATQSATGKRREAHGRLRRATLLPYHKETKDITDRIRRKNEHGCRGFCGGVQGLGFRV
jgi:hypothetical protein